MTDQRFTELLGKELAGEISQEESVELKSLLVDNSAYLNEYEKLRLLFESEEAEDENIDRVYDRIKARIQVPVKAKLAPAAMRNNRFPLWLKVAAVLVLICSVVFLYTQFTNPPAAASQIVWSNVKTKASQIRTVVLADGSIVKLNAVSSLRYPQSFKGSEREVYLSGEALFEVKKDPVHPFIVHTEELNVKVLGTIFNVKAFSNDEYTEATLFQGRVAVTLANQPEREFILKPQDKLNLIHGDAQPALSRIAPYTQKDVIGFLETGWTRHELVFKNRNFEDVAKLFERWYGLNITFKQQELKTLNFTGLFKNETLPEALDALKLIEPFKYSISDKNVTIYK